MAEYIEREALMQKFADWVKRSNNSDFAPQPTWNQAIQIAEDIPAADVRPVVRCKDCIHWRDDIIASGAHYCFVFNWRNTESDFCSFGERV